jgi:hypothetical protein
MPGASGGLRAVGWTEVDEEEDLTIDERLIADDHPIGHSMAEHGSTIAMCACQRLSGRRSATSMFSARSRLGLGESPLAADIPGEALTG